MEFPKKSVAATCFAALTLTLLPLTASAAPISGGGFVIQAEDMDDSRIVARVGMVESGATDPSPEVPGDSSENPGGDTTPKPLFPEAGELTPVSSTIPLVEKEPTYWYAKNGILSYQMGHLFSASGEVAPGNRSLLTEVQELFGSGDYAHISNTASDGKGGIYLTTVRNPRSNSGKAIVNLVAVRDNGLESVAEFDTGIDYINNRTSITATKSGYYLFGDNRDDRAFNVRKIEGDRLGPIVEIKLSEGDSGYSTIHGYAVANDGSVVVRSYGNLIFFDNGGNRVKTIPNSEFGDIATLPTGGYAVARNSSIDFYDTAGSLEKSVAIEGGLSQMSSSVDGKLTLVTGGGYDEELGGEIFKLETLDLYTGERLHWANLYPEAPQ